MSIVIATVTPNGIIMGADTMRIQGNIKETGIQKVWWHDNILVGFTGPSMYRAGVNLALKGEVNEHYATKRDRDAVFATMVGNRLRAWAKERGCGETEAGTPYLRCDVLLGLGSTLWHVSGDGFTEQVKDVVAIGIGQEAALASFKTRPYKPNPARKSDEYALNILYPATANQTDTVDYEIAYERIETAVSVAIDLVQHCGGTPNVLGSWLGPGKSPAYVLGRNIYDTIKTLDNQENA